jgi:regulatory protein
VLDYLNELKLIDDAAFADWFVVSRLNHKPKGPLIIRQELKRFGVSSELIEQALSKIDPQNYYQAALRLLEKNARKFEHLPAYQAKLKAGTFLYSKGFETVTREAAIDDFFNKQ